MSGADEKDARASHESSGATGSSQDKGRPGMPKRASIVSEKAFRSPKGKRYRIIRTDETDPYDAPVPPKE